MATQADLDAIDAAITRIITGEQVTQVSYEGYTAQFTSASLPQLRAERARVAQLVAAEDGTRRRPRVLRSRYRSGL
ncbi:gpW protein [Thiohalospira halophila DSM 15071]|uniref:GpW protein n=1 Tax=Thiohalospira halophila DSM 15071 TaxID=1123397 RepID=A0A1I1UAG9_9GAMM|nr:gpW family head-tail joining protein [Thiohalospira halophila]SFD67737.1 gpW protein [Thiohalospira halophila DSM 15071]